MDKVTGQHPIYKHVYSTYINGKHYDINTDTGKVWECKFSPRKGSYNKDVTSKKIIQAVKDLISWNQ
jgi:hypothetical protein